MCDWTLLNKHRISTAQDPNFGTESSAGFNGLFRLRINGLPIRCIASDGGAWKHVSISIESTGINMTPSWSIMTQVKDLFWEPEDWVVQFHPAHSEYVNLHPGVLHLWQPLNAELPKPDRLMVGPKNEDDMKKVEANEQIPLWQRVAARLAFAARNRNK